MKRIVQAALLALLVLPLAFCVHSDGAIEGKVLDGKTRKPMPGMFVIVKWGGSMFAMVESRSVCVHLEIAVTDAAGNYRIPSWWTVYSPAYVSNVGHGVSFYGRGYELSPEYYRAARDDPYTLLVRPYKGAAQHRLDDLQNMVGPGCGPTAEYANELKPFYRALYEEAKSIAVTKEEKHIAGSLHYSMDALELGRDEADSKLKKGKYESE